MPEPTLDIVVSDGWATGCRFLADGSLLTTAVDPFIKHWSASGEPLTSFEGHTKSVDALAVDAEKGLLVSGSVDGTVRSWDIAETEAVRTFEGHRKTVAGVAIAPDGDQIASASYDGTVRLWDAETGDELATMKEHPKNVLSVDFSPSDAVLASGGIGGDLLLWALPFGEPLGGIEAHEFAVSCVRFVGPRRLVSTGADDMLRIWDVETADLVSEVPLGAGGTHAAAVTPDQRHAAVTLDREVAIVDLEAADVVARLGFDVKGVYGASFNDTGTLLATASADRSVRVWRFEDLLGE